MPRPPDCRSRCTRSPHIARLPPHIHGRSTNQTVPSLLSAVSPRPQSPPQICTKPLERPSGAHSGPLSWLLLPWLPAASQRSSRPYSPNPKSTKQKRLHNSQHCNRFQNQNRGPQEKLLQPDFHTYALLFGGRWLLDSIWAFALQCHLSTFAFSTLLSQHCEYLMYNSAIAHFWIRAVAALRAN